MPYYIKDPKRDHNFDNHPCVYQGNPHINPRDPDQALLKFSCNRAMKAEAYRLHLCIDGCPKKRKNHKTRPNTCDLWKALLMIGLQASVSGRSTPSSPKSPQPSETARATLTVHLSPNAQKAQDEP